MKLCLLFVVLCACEKPDDMATVRTESTEVVTYYQGQLDELDDRLHAIIKRGLKLDRPLPGSDAAGRLVNDTNVKLIRLNDRLGELAKEMAAATTAQALQMLTDEYKDVAELGTRDKDQPIVGVMGLGGALATTESWLTRAEGQMAALGSAH